VPCAGILAVPKPYLHGFCILKVLQQLNSPAMLHL
jgi:hypothetical protein